LKHESNVEHLFVVPGSARQFKIVLVEYTPLLPNPWNLLC